ncbi:hypothetical protein PCA20602_02931 [Pandoraea capi]|uniref:IPT/TIG domain-containing protein n=1 Tax=Pandoraea capi TaxID=2508286 RepID=A0ABY6W259_9BURK|nr:IPT/TIG domain-containing protein [Pandoraea capi]VVE16811.1 hypothetical protein PCA20602_02931 [Pandoraea capi]
MASITSTTLDMVERKGGGQFTITGAGFSKAVQVYFVDASSKKIPATSYTLVSDTKITGVVPAFTSPAQQRSM